MIEESVRTAQLTEAVENDEAYEMRQEQAFPAEPVESRAESQSLLESEYIDDLQSRWNRVQIEFVDQPHASVEQAGALVTEAMGKVSQALTDQQRALDERWANHEDVSTEDLRVTLQLYRSFFNHLLAL